MSAERSPDVLGVAVEQYSWLGMELIEALAAAARDSGVAVRRVRDAEDERQVGHVIAIGHAWMYPGVLSRPRSARRTLWYGEWLPPDGPAPVATRASLWQRLPQGRRVDAAGRCVLDALLAASAGGRAPRIERTLLGLKERAAVERDGSRHLAELAADAHAFDDVVVTSHDKAAAAARTGVTARVIPYGYHPSLCGPIVDPSSDTRDIPVLFIGALATRGFRRGRILAAIEHAAPFRIHAVRGGIHGAERHALLRRVRVVLDIHRVPGNLAALRWLHAAAAGAVLVTEPFIDPRPLVPGEHFVQADPDHLADAAAAILDDEPRRVAMAERCQRLLREPLHMRASLRRLMADRT